MLLIIRTLSVSRGASFASAMVLATQKQLGDNGVNFATKQITGPLISGADIKGLRHTLLFLSHTQTHANTLIIYAKKYNHTHTQTSRRIHTTTHTIIYCIHASTRQSLTCIHPFTHTHTYIHRHNHLYKTQTYITTSNKVWRFCLVFTLFLGNRCFIAGFLVTLIYL